MTNYVQGKSVVVTGAGSGFGKLISQKAAALGASVTCGDIDSDTVEAVADEIRRDGGQAQACRADVTRPTDMRALVSAAVETFGRVDIMINNAGIMPLAFVADHEIALDAWSRCIDINLKGVINGSVAVYDQMVAQGQGQIINIASIFGNHPVAGSAVYGATKAAIIHFSDALRVEARGKIKVTTIRPTGVPGTGLVAGVLNPNAGMGIVGHFAQAFHEVAAKVYTGTAPAEWTDPESIECVYPQPENIADAMLYTMNQPWGISISDMTVRASGEYNII
jgi:NADP-dependent 3-hydroxy acid dehydrogenase YdfG